jgi:hypothetical protein
MVMGHNIRDARYILTGDSIEDLEKGLAEMKRQIAAGITFSVCYGGDKSELEKECDNDDPNDDCNDCDYDIIDSYGNYDSEYECEDNDDWDICYEDEEEEEETEVKEEVDKNKAITEMTEEIIATIKDILGI